MRFTRPAALAVLLTVGLAVAGCSGSADDAPAPGDPGDAPSGSFTVKVDKDLADAVPDGIRSAGVLRVATDPTYPPFETVIDDKIVGLDADLAQGIADMLDLELKWSRVSFDGIIPGLQADSADIAFSSIGDNKEREQAVDFATAYWNGTLLVVPSGNPMKGAPEMACDMQVGVIRGSLQQTQFLPAQEKPCTEAGKKAPVEAVYQNSNQAVLALQSGRIDAVLVDAPAASTAVKQVGDAFEIAGPIIRNPNPAGAAFPKGSELAPVVADAINALIADGTYEKMLAKWSLDDIAIDESVINGAVE